MKSFSKKEVARHLKKFPEWKANPSCTAISRTYATKDFVSGLALIARITVYAEVMDHHPDIEFSYGKVKVKLSTHSAKGLTEKDFKLAAWIEGIG